MCTSPAGQEVHTLVDVPEYSALELQPKNLRSDSDWYLQKIKMLGCVIVKEMFLFPYIVNGIACKALYLNMSVSVDNYLCLILHFGQNMK